MDTKKSSAGIVWTIIIIVIIVIVGGIVYYEHENGEYMSSTAAPAADQTGSANPANNGTAADTSGAPMIPYYTLAATTSPSVGQYLVAANGMTLYTYSKDSSGVSACTGGCATAWPPYTVSSPTGLATSPSLTGQIATITRADGTTQVTYNGMPLYFWQGDSNPGDTTGNKLNGFTVATP